MNIFNKFWNQESLQVFLDEYIEQKDAEYFCDFSLYFKDNIWNQYSERIKILAGNFLKETNSKAYIGDHAIFHTSNEKQIRIDFLKFEINRLKTLNALKKSIQKWEDIVSGKKEEPDCTNCPLCYEFYGDECKGCPVMKKTGKHFCADTPYNDAWNAWKVFEKKGLTSHQEYIEAAKEELSFLKSLLTNRKNLI